MVPVFLLHGRMVYNRQEWSIISPEIPEEHLTDNWYDCTSDIV